ncbi:MAG: hypothetical protein FWF05_01255 [Oscillospiraceae bacterium]|nr:hypothetical protein [Oscillospiraceae bacterium]
MRTKISIENKRVLIRRLAFGAGLVAVAAIQNTQGLLLSVFGIRAMPLIPAVVCVAMFERELSGVLYGLFAGLLWDMCSVSGGSFNAILLSAIGFACGALITHLMRNNLVTALLLGSGAAMIHQFAYWARVYVFEQRMDGALSLFTFYIPSCVYTLMWLPGFYFLVRAAMKRLN